MKTFALVSINGCILSVYKTDTIDSIIHIQNHSQQVIEIRHDVDCCNAFYDNSTKEVKQKPDAPSLHHVFNYTTKQWEDPRTLQDLKDAQWAKIKQARAAAIAAPLVTPYGTFDADEYSRTAITDSVLLLQTLSKRGQPQTIRFTLADNTDIDLSVSQIEDVGLMLGEKTNLVFEKVRLLREAIEAATSREAVEAIVW